MATTVSSLLYPLDTTGEATSNKVIDEVQTLVPATGSGEFNFIIPGATPFYRDTVVLVHGSAETPLVRGVHWQPGHKFMSASAELSHIKGGVYGSILLMNKNLSGTVKLKSYQTVGGEWTLSAAKILEILNARLVDPRTYSYEQVNGKPTVFPPQNHGHAGTEDFTGFGELILAVNEIPAAIREQTDMWINNPPILMSQFYTKTQIHALFDPLEVRVTALEARP